MTRRPAMRQRIRRVPVLGSTLVGLVRVVRQSRFRGSRDYWDRRYADGGTSGAGSAGALARFKSGVLNDFVAFNEVGSVIEIGCGDGQQLALASYPRYLGLDVSAPTLRRTMSLFLDDPTKSFMLYDPLHYTDPAMLVAADLAISLDVIYHLVEDEVYRLHLRHVFGSARRFVVLFTSDADTLDIVERTAPHVRHRPVVRDIAEHFPAWRLRERIANRYPYRGAGTDTSFADFFVYERVAAAPWPA
jgi:SAM-dependent methyltransferase